MSEPVQAMVLAAGLGTRLWPLTADRAKPAIPFLGRPLIEGIVELLGRHGVGHAVVNTHHRADSIHAALTGDAPFGVKLSFSHETEILGTAGGLAEAVEQELLDPELTTLVINAKLHTDLDLRGVLDAHDEAGAAVTMVLRDNTKLEAFREVMLEGDRVVGFGASRQPAGSNCLLFTGIHVLEPEVLATIPKGFSDTVADVYPPLIRQRRVMGHIDDSGNWWEFSTLKRYLELHERAARDGFGPDVARGPGTVIEPGAVVRRSILWENVHVPGDAQLDRVVLGAGVRLPPGTNLERAIVVRRALVEEVQRGQVHGDLLVVPA